MHYYQVCCGQQGDTCYHHLDTGALVVALVALYNWYIPGLKAPWIDPLV